MFVFAILLVLLTACTNATPGPIPTATTPPLTGQIDIEYPPASAQIYAEVIRIAGSIADVPAKSFEIRLMGPDDTLLKRIAVDAPAGAWSLDLLHGYAGEPIEVTIVAGPADQSGIYDAAIVQMAGLAHRPADFRAEVLTPASASVVGGESFEASGRASGAGTPTLQLVTADGHVLDTQPLGVANPFVVDILPWRAALATAGYTGPAIIQVTSEDSLITSHPITITEEAG